MNSIDYSFSRISGLAPCLLACSMILLSACAPESGGSASGPQAVERGGAVFDENCAVCHGAGARGPSLDGIKALSPAERGDRIRNHPVAGQIPQRLPANQLADVLEFFGAD